MGTEIPDPQAFIAKYGPDAVVKLGDTQMPLGSALAAEALLCPADAANRLDPAKRLAYVAGMLATGGSLLPEDSHYVRRD